MTKSLVPRIASLPKKEQSILCYIQNKVVIEARKKRAGMFVDIHSRYLQDKCKNYPKYLEMLIQWGELERNLPYCNDASKSPTGKTYPRSYRIPLKAWNSGITKIDFRCKKRRAPVDKSTATGPIIDYQRACYQQLIVKDTFIAPQDSYRFNAVVRGLEAVSVGAADFTYGDKVNRLYHTIITMPKEGRVNIAHKSGRKLGEGDMTTCHPVLFYPLCGPEEKKDYGEFCNDPYTKLIVELGISYTPEQLARYEDKPKTTRDAVKIDFMMFYNGGIKNYVYKEYSRRFPILTARIMEMGKGTAIYLQNLEAEIMLDKVAPECERRGLFYINEHDGWFGLEDEAAEVARIVIEQTERTIGFAPQIKFTNLETGLKQVFTKNSLYNPILSSSISSLSYVMRNGEHRKIDKKPILSPFDRYKALETLAARYEGMEPPSHPYIDNSPLGSRAFGAPAGLYEPSPP